MGDRRFAPWSDPSSADPEALGGRDPSLARRSALELPVPPSFAVGGTVATVRGTDPGTGTHPLHAAGLAEGIDLLEREVGCRFGDPHRPLLVSVRPGSAPAEPDPVGTVVVGVGLNDETVRALLARLPSAWSHYERLLHSYGRVVGAIPGPALDALVAEAAAPAQGCELLKDLLAASGHPFPDDVCAQLDVVAGRLAGDVVVQAMVLGCGGPGSGSGTVFTRDPLFGRPEARGEFTEVLEPILSDVETAHRDMCEIEFAIEEGRPWVLRVRPGRRSATAAVRIAVDLVDEGMIEVREALARVAPAALQDLQLPVVARGQRLEVIATGLPAFPGAATGVAAFDVEQARRLAAGGDDVVFVCPEPSPWSLDVLRLVRGVVFTGACGAPPPVAVREIGRPAVCGATALTVDVRAGVARLDGGEPVYAGDEISVDGESGKVMRGVATLVPPQPSPYLSRFLQWCDEAGRVPVLDRPPDDYVRVTAAEDLEVAAPRVLLACDAADDAAARIAHLARAAIETLTIESLMLELPDRLDGARPELPTGPWRGIVAGRETEWAARLLSATMPA